MWMRSLRSMPRVHSGRDAWRVLKAASDANPQLAARHSGTLPGEELRTCCLT